PALLTVLQTKVRVAQPDEHEQLAELYLRWDYRGGIDDADIVYVAEQGDRPVGLVRRTFECGVTMLRGMHVDPAHHSQGVGSQLLHALVADLTGQECFCMPFTHLIAFYERGAFAVIDEDAAPEFLVKRLYQYRQKGYNVLIMRRAGARHVHRLANQVAADERLLVNE
ncbi:MAG: GNAT family N-acetyltransferase, partial [Gemmatimonadaceae bacterium]